MSRLAAIVILYAGARDLATQDGCNPLSLETWGFDSLSQHWPIFLMGVSCARNRAYR